MRALEPRIGRRGTPAVAVLDIEQLSTINDSFGRHAGDLLLQQVADRLKRHFDSTELLAHFGAGTFGLIMEAAGDEDEAVHWMQEQVIDVFRAPFTVDGRGIPVDVKCGFARYPDNGNDANALVQNAEAALRSAKSTGEKYLHHRLELSAGGGLAHDHGASPARRGRAPGIRAALPAQDTTCAAAQMRGLEALVRWRDPEAGLVMPGVFLSLMESSGLIVPLGDWILRQAAADLRRWQGAGLAPGPRGRQHLTGAAAPPRLRRSPARPGRRMAQREHRHRHRNHRGRVDRRRELGGLAAARAAALGRARRHRRFRHRLFLAEPPGGTAGRHAQDRSQLRERSSPPAAPAARVAETIIALGKAFNMTTLAEGVETPEQFEMLAHMGCDQSQGYLHSRPLAAADIEPC